MIIFTTLRDVQPSEFEQAADGFHTISSAAAQGKDKIAQQVLAKKFPNTKDSSGGGLSGSAAAAAERRLERLQNNLHYVQVECGLISAALNSFASDIREVKKKLNSVIEEIQERGFSLDSDGSVTYPAAGKGDSGKSPGGTTKGYTDEAAQAVADQAASLDPNPNSSHAQALANRIARVLGEATDID